MMIIFFSEGKEMLVIFLKIEADEKNYRRYMLDIPI